MLIYPAIDLKDGACVRLLQGRAEDATVYGRDPAAMARRWAEAGARRLHVVDLDGAFTGEGKNLKAVKAIREAVPALALQLGGGIRTMADVEARFELGVDRVILGTAAIRDPEFAGKCIERFGAAHIVIGIDAKDGIAAAEGWTEASGISATELGKKMAGMGATECVYTDIARDGMLTGPNLNRTKEMIEATGLHIVASGGMSSLDDLTNCAALGCAGAILGKALYDGRINLRDALALTGCEA